LWQPQILLRFEAFDIRKVGGQKHSTQLIPRVTAGGELKVCHLCGKTL
jgi:hypothetical protein